MASAQTYLSLSSSLGAGTPKTVYSTLEFPTAVYDNTFNLASGAASAHTMQDFAGGASNVSLIVQNQGPGDILFSCSYFAPGAVVSAAVYHIPAGGFPLVLPGMVASANASSTLESSSAAVVRMIGYY
jgi:hypothetical protein